MQNPAIESKTADNTATQFAFGVGLVSLATMFKMQHPHPYIFSFGASFIAASIFRRFNLPAKKN